jgi:drug/metabolite transporter (DMT)-like permease
MNQKRAFALGIVTILCWGSLATFGNLLLHLPPFYTLGVTFLIGSVPGLFNFRKMFPPFSVLIWGVAGYFGYHFFLFYAFRFAPAIEANLINYLWPVFMVLFTPIAFKQQKLKSYHILGGILSILGCLVLVSGQIEKMQSESIKGYLLALAAAVTWPVYSIVKKKLPPTEVWAIASFCLFSGMLCLLTHYLIEPRVVLQTRDALLLITMGLGPFGLAFYCWDLALREGDSRALGALAYLTPVLSTLGLILLTGQNLSKTTFTAMVLIIGGASVGLLDFLPSKR